MDSFTVNAVGCTHMSPTCISLSGNKARFSLFLMLNQSNIYNNARSRRYAKVLSYHSIIYHISNSVECQVFKRYFSTRGWLVIYNGSHMFSLGEVYRASESFPWVFAYWLVSVFLRKGQPIYSCCYYSFSSIKGLGTVRYHIVSRHVLIQGVNL